MIIDKHKIIFVHIPKTAGVSIVHGFLGEGKKKKKLSRGSIWKLPDHQKEAYGLNGINKHRTALEYQQEEGDKFAEYYKFAIVRNPWDRAISEYHWRLRKQHNKAKNTFGNFSQYISMVRKVVTLPPPPDKTQYDRMLWDHVIPQHKYIVDENENLLVDDVIMFSDIPSGIAKLNEKFDIDLKLGKHNTSKHGHYSTYYNDLSKEIIKNIYRKDIEMFNFEF